MRIQFDSLGLRLNGIDVHRQCNTGNRVRDLTVSILWNVLPETEVIKYCPQFANDFVSKWRFPIDEWIDIEEWVNKTKGVNI